MKNYSLGTRKSIYTDAIHNYLEKVFSWPKQGLRRFAIPEGVRYEDGILEYLPEVFISL
jgi:hypothetical protein